MTVGREAPASSASFRNDYKLPAAVSSRAEVHVGMGVMYRDSIETQSREISGCNASYTISEILKKFFYFAKESLLPVHGSRLLSIFNGNAVYCLSGSSMIFFEPYI